MTKEKARKVFQKKRDALTQGARSRRDRAIFSHLVSIPCWQTISVLHTYLPMPGKNEVNTWDFIELVQKFADHIKISVPKVKGDFLENYYYEDKNQLAENRWGILEPERGEKTPTEAIDVVLVPLLAFDKNLHRVGYGKGYYDKFLKTCRKDCLFVGLSYFPPIDIIDDLHPNDIALHQVITPKKIY